LRFIIDYFSFDHPWVLIAFTVFIPLFLYDIFSGSQKSRQRLSRELVKKLKVSIILFRLFISLVIIALAGPRWGTGYTASEFRRGLDVVFAIDVSRSMDIRDANNTAVQSRLERGLLIARESASAAAGIRFAAAIGRSRGFLAVPLTWDNEAVLSFLEVFDASSMTGRSTNLETLIDAAASAFHISFPSRKLIVFISDGESHSGVLRNAIDRCAKDGIIVSSIAMGSDEGRPVPAYHSSPGDLGFSRRNAPVMRMAAERTGGIYIDGSRDDAAGILAAHLNSLARDTGFGSRSTEPKEQRTLFIILAIITYGASKIFPLLPRLSHSSLLFLLIICFPWLQSCSQGKLFLIEANYLHSRGRYDEAIVSYLKAVNYKDAAPYAEYGLGITFYLLDEGNAALKRFEDSQKLLEGFISGEHRELRYRNNYNSGVILFGDGDFSAAAAAFKEALRTDPRRIEAKHNLELSLISLAGEPTGDNNPEMKQENRAMDILFDYLRQKEMQQWRSREWSVEEESSGPDY
jgi:Ca-activated chloride channel family protein